MRRRGILSIGGGGKYINKPLKFTSVGASSFKIKNNGQTATQPNIEYSYDNENWTTLGYSSSTESNTVTLSDGESVYLRGNNNGINSSSSSYWIFNITGQIQVTGNIMYLIDRAGETTTIPSNYAFYGLFYNCTGLLSAPDLPAENLTDYCYTAMFQGCSSLTEAPELPAKTLAARCYSSMFRGSGIISAPTLPATTLTDYCYNQMFASCTSLISAPNLPATTLANNCYYSMFNGCTKLVVGPEIHGITPVSNCFIRMFYGCTKLNSVKIWVTSWNTSYSSDWLNKVASAGTVYKLSTTTITTNSNSGIPRNWTASPIS